MAHATVSRMTTLVSVASLTFSVVAAEAQDGALLELLGMNEVAVRYEVDPRASVQSETDFSLNMVQAWIGDPDIAMVRGTIEVPDLDAPGTIVVRHRWGFDEDSGALVVTLLESTYSESAKATLGEGGGGDQQCEAHALVFTKDIVDIPVAWTSTSLYWTHVTGSPECADWSSGICSPISPTDAGTHWYNYSACQITPVTQSQAAPFSAQTVGHYYNWDFPPPNTFTYADHINLIKRANHATQFQWSSIASGDFYLLLHGEIVTSESCY